MESCVRIDSIEEQDVGSVIDDVPCDIQYVRRAKRENARYHPGMPDCPAPGPRKETGERETQQEEMK